MRLAAILHDRVRPDSGPDDLDVLEQVAAVESALRALGWRVSTLPCDLDLATLAERLRRDPPDLCFNLVESLGGHGRLAPVVPALLESLVVRFTGAGSSAMFAATHKTLAKRLLRASGVPTPDWLDAAALADPRASAAPGRWIIKSVWEHASRGLDEDSVVEIAGGTDADRARTLASALRPRLGSLGGEGFVERYVHGREFNVAVLAGRVLPLAEMVFRGHDAGRPRVVGFRAKWDPTATEYHDTVRAFLADAEPELARSVADVVSRCWSLFGLRGWARVDLRVDAAGTPWVIDVNANPCLSPDAGFAAAVAEAGLSFADAIAQIIEDAE